MRQTLVECLMKLFVALTLFLFKGMELMQIQKMRENCRSLPYWINWWNRHSRNWMSNYAWKSCWKLSHPLKCHTRFVQIHSAGHCSTYSHIFLLFLFCILHFISHSCLSIERGYSSRNTERFLNVAALRSSKFLVWWIWSICAGLWQHDSSDNTFNTVDQRE